MNYSTAKTILFLYRKKMIKAKENSVTSSTSDSTHCCTNLISIRTKYAEVKLGNQKIEILSTIGNFMNFECPNSQNSRSNEKGKDVKIIY
jgi:hypothetical protein